MDNQILLKVKNYILDYYKKYIPAENIYHNIYHIQQTVEYVMQIGKHCNISDEDMELLLIAAWFHDTGYTSTREGHENKSIKIAKKYLTNINYPSEKINKVCNLISVTEIPQKPKNLLEEIICDADLAHLGTKDFFDQTELLRLEFEKKEKREITDFEWLKLNIDFLTSSKFFTNYAKSEFEPTKMKNILKLQKKYKKKVESRKNQKTRKEKIDIEKKKLSAKSVQAKKSDRGIETMFRNVMRTHVSFSSMADSKANIMISVNTLLLGGIFTILTRQLNVYPNLIIPTFVLVLTSLTTLILSVLVTRPKVSSGTFTREDVENKKVNLLFFGNFFNMNLKDFTLGMNELIDDKEFLYESMIKDFYYLGQVLGKKYKLLRLAYTIFMYGIILSAVLFCIFVFFYESNSVITNIIE
ncbi:MAG: HD family phosphohydrolase [Ignavibacteriae bacterium]|nr:MAG: HD family phosphohydrolase [Ignavibacteriota bacterium]